MNLSDLGPSLSELSYDDALSLIVSIRNSRRTPKKLSAEAKPKKTTSSKAKKELTADELIAALPKEFVQRLAEKLSEARKCF